MSDQPKEQRTWTEEIDVSGDELVERVKELIEEGNVRRLIVRNLEGETILEVPLTTGALVAIFAPKLAALGAMAALLSRVTIQIVRADVEGGGEGEAKG